MEHNNILGTVLAGGKSQRFGEDKSQILLADKILIDYILAEIIDEFKEVLIVSNNSIKFMKILVAGSTGLVGKTLITDFLQEHEVIAISRRPFKFPNNVKQELIDFNKDFSLKDTVGKFVVLYFYPKDDTPGCTKEAIEFTNYFEKLKKLGVKIIGVSKDSIEKT